MDPVTRDFYEERRRKWRRSAFWRGFLVALLISGVVAVVYQLGAGGPPSGPHIARYQVANIIYNDADRDGLLAELAEDDDVLALMLIIDSPGGTTAGGEALYDAVRGVAGAKPVVAVMGEVAASAAYLAAISADHVVARGNTLTGSVGVIMEYPDVSGLMGRIGIEMETFRSSELKAEPSPFRPASPEGRAAQQALIADSYRWFRGLVGERRGLEGPALERATDGRVFTGRQARDAGLVDALGGEAAARAWLESVDPRLADAPIETWELEQEDGGWLDFFATLGPLGAKLDGIPLAQGPRLMSILK